MRILTKMSYSYSDNRLIFPDNASPHAMKDVLYVKKLSPLGWLN